MTYYDDTIAIIDALNVLTRAMGIEVNEPAQPFRQDASKIELTIQKLQTGIESTTCIDRMYLRGQINALKWVLGVEDED